MKVLICGGGVIGAAIACYLALRGARPVLIERTGLACAASGKAGGFLALDWCDGTALGPLARRSFELHARLPDEICGDWGYRRLDTFAGVAPRPFHASGLVAWTAPEVAIRQRLGSPETTAQVDPARFTRALAAAALARGGAEILTGEVTGLLDGAGGRPLRGVLVDGHPVEGDAVVIAMGPWSGRAAAWLPLPAILAVKGHSLVYETGDRIPAQALFLEERAPDGRAATPEIFPRTDGTTYLSALSSDAPLPEDPAQVLPDPGAIERLEAIGARLSPVLTTSRVLARQACFRPVARDGLPLIGAVPEVPGAYVATGHGVWGILNAPATGEAMAGLLLDGVAALDLAAFRPDRLPPARRLS